MQQPSRARVSLSSLGVVLALVALFGTSFAPPALARGPATEEELAKVAELGRGLETAPRGAEADASREWLMSFLSEVPGFTVKLCYSLLGSTAERHGIPQELQQQHVFSSAAYLVENPDAGAGDTATLMAGVEGTLRAYKAWRESDEGFSNPRLDELLTMEQAGQLVGYVRAQGRYCR